VKRIGSPIERVRRCGLYAAEPETPGLSEARPKRLGRAPVKQALGSRAMGRGSRSVRRWRNDRKKKKAEREKRRSAALARPGRPRWLSPSGSSTTARTGSAPVAHPNGPALSLDWRAQGEQW